MSRIVKEPHTPEKSSYVDSAFWDIDKSIGRAYRIGYPVYCSSTHLVSVRVIPKHLQERLTSLACKDAASKTPPLINGNFSIGQNKWGAMSFFTYHDSDSIMSGTQVFKSREIWMFANEIMWQRDADDKNDAAWFIGHYTIMKYLPEAIGNAVQLAGQIIEGEASVKLTASSLIGVHVLTGQSAKPQMVEITEPSISIDCPLNDQLSPDDLAFDFARRIYEEAGVPLNERVRSGQLN